MFTWTMMGKRVAFSASSAWSEYTIVDAKMAIPLPADVPMDKGASTIVNPLTVLCMLREAVARKQRHILHTAAASQLGLMLIREARTMGIDVICVVRREEQAEACRAVGAQDVFVSTAPDFLSALRERLTAVKCQLAFDAVGGEMTGLIFNALPPHATVKVYGGLSLEPCRGIDIGGLIFANKRVEGFYMPDALKSLNMIAQLRVTRRAASLVTGTLQTAITRTVSMDEVAQGVWHYKTNMSQGKVLIGVLRAAVDAPATAASPTPETESKPAPAPAASTAPAPVPQPSANTEAPEPKAATTAEAAAPVATVEGAAAAADEVAADDAV